MYSAPPPQSFYNYTTFLHYITVCGDVTVMGGRAFADDLTRSPSRAQEEGPDARRRTDLHPSRTPS